MAKNIKEYQDIWKKILQKQLKQFCFNVSLTMFEFEQFQLIGF